jgi:(p)ppGpp synthase/HD superfamily hydrolase
MTAQEASRGPLWQRAISFAARAHRHQLRKDNGTPYVAHPCRVMATLALVFGCTDEVALAAAVLHDTIEDTTTDYDDLLQHFGPEVATLVASLTKNMARPEAAREAEYDAALARADWRARLIKLADVYDNLSDLETSPAEHRTTKTRRAADKARRALALAEGDQSHPPIRLALAEVRSLLSGFGS